MVLFTNFVIQKLNIIKSFYQFCMTSIYITCKKKKQTLNNIHENFNITFSSYKENINKI